MAHLGFTSEAGTLYCLQNLNHITEITAKIGTISILHHSCLDKLVLIVGTLKYFVNKLDTLKTSPKFLVNKDEDKPASTSLFHWMASSIDPHFRTKTIG